MRDNKYIGDTIKLAWPLVLTQLGHVVTGMVDNAFLGRIGAAEQAAGILCNSIYVLLLVFGIGVSYALTPLTTGAVEGGNERKMASLFKNSLYFNLGIAAACFFILFVSSDVLHYMRQPEEVVKLAMPFYSIIIFSIVPISLFFTCKQYCEGLSNTKIALYVSISGNVINCILNYCLIYGKFGLPEMGYMGAAYATLIARVFMGLSFLVIVFRSDATRQIAKYYSAVKVNLAELKELATIGINSGLQFVFEVAAFVIAGLMCGSFGKEQMDAHGVSLQMAAFTYMFASGIASAATIQMGILNAKNNWNEIRKAGRACVQLVLLVMGFFGICFFTLRTYLPLGFTDVPYIVELSSNLLVIAALFQLFDGLQVTVIGMLRGLEDVKVSTWITLVGYWLIALPLAYLLAFTLKMESVGVWISLLVSLAFVAGGLYWRFVYLVNRNLENDRCCGAAEGQPSNLEEVEL